MGKVVVLLFIILIGVGGYFSYFQPEKTINYLLKIVTYMSNNEYLTVQIATYHFYNLFGVIESYEFSSYLQGNFKHLDVESQQNFSFSLSQGNLIIPSLKSPPHLVYRHFIPADRLKPLFSDIEVTCYQNQSTSFQCTITHRVLTHEGSKMNDINSISLLAGQVIIQRIPSYIDPSTPVKSIKLFAVLGFKEEDAESEYFFAPPSETLLRIALHPYISIMQDSRIPISIHPVTSIELKDSNYHWNNDYCFLNHTHSFVPCSLKEKE